MKPGLVIVDMLKDTFVEHPNAYISKTAMAFVPRLNEISAAFRQNGYPVIYSNDSFFKEDFIFKGRMKPHSLRGEKGAEVIDQLDVEQGDFIVPKRRFSGFFKTDLDQTLRTCNVDTVVVAGIATHICVLMTLLDAVASDFYAVLLKDCSAATSLEIHENTIKSYENCPLVPLMRIMDSGAFMEECFSINQ